MFAQFVLWPCQVSGRSSLGIPICRRCHWFRQIQQPSLPLSRDVAIPLRHLDTVCEHSFRGFVSLAVDEDHLALLHFQSYLVYRNGAAPNPAMMTQFRPPGGSFQTGLSPTTSRMAPKKAPRMGFPFSVPHDAPLDSPNGRWDRRCRDCSYAGRDCDHFASAYLTTLVEKWSVAYRSQNQIGARRGCSRSS